MGVAKRIKSLFDKIAESRGFHPDMFGKEPVDLKTFVGPREPYKGSYMRGGGRYQDIENFNGDYDIEAEMIKGLKGRGPWKGDEMYYPTRNDVRNQYYVEYMRPKGMSRDQYEANMDQAVLDDWKKNLMTIMQDYSKKGWDDERILKNFGDFGD